MKKDIRIETVITGNEKEHVSSHCKCSAEVTSGHMTLTSALARVKLSIKTKDNS